MTSPRFTLTQYLDYIKPLFIDALGDFVLHKEKLVNKPTKVMSRHEENITAMYVGLMVDILTRAQLLADKQNHFALRKALCQVSPAANQLKTNVALRKENDLVEQIKEPGWDAVVKLNEVLHGLDHWRLARRPRLTRVNRKTVNNILYMVDISVKHLQDIPKLTTGNTLGGPCFSKLYPAKIDYVSATGLWDMVVSEYEPHPTQILKLMAYDILAFDTPAYKEQEFTEVGVINPRIEYRYWLSCKHFPVDVYETLRSMLISPEPEMK